MSIWDDKLFKEQIVNAFRPAMKGKTKEQIDEFISALLDDRWPAPCAVCGEQTRANERGALMVNGPIICWRHRGNALPNQIDNYEHGMKIAYETLGLAIRILKKATHVH